MNVQPITDADIERVVAFFDRVPDGDRTFFKEPFAGDDTVRAWLADGSTRLLAVDDDERGGGRDVPESVVGYAAVVAGVGWSSHVGELRLVVDPAQRRRGLGHALAKAALAAGLEAGLTKIVVEAISTQDATIALFTQLGFVPEALLEGHVRDAAGELRDLLVLAMRGDDTWSTLTTVGLDSPLD